MKRTKTFLATDRDKEVKVTISFKSDGQRLMKSESEERFNSIIEDLFKALMVRFNYNEIKEIKR